MKKNKEEEGARHRLRLPRYVYLSDASYSRYKAAAAEREMSFSQWAKMAMDGLVAKQARFQRVTKIEPPIALYDNGWPVNAPCWICGELHDGAVHGPAYKFSEKELQDALALARKI